VVAFVFARLAALDVPWAIATSGHIESARPTLEFLDVPEGVPVVTRDRVRWAKPDPDLFLEAIAQLGVSPEAATVVGDSVWDPPGRATGTRARRRRPIGRVRGG
jgi:beta-phosphoglucomutase-like phosphatase (HAD superfamily)